MKYVNLLKTIYFVVCCSIVTLTSCEVDEQSEIYDSIDNSISTLKASSNSNFEIGFQFCDEAVGLNIGPWEYASSNSSVWTSWISDNNVWDPDGIRISLQKDLIGNIELNEDFRIVAQATDQHGDVAYAGTAIATPWASQGGGWSLGYVTDNNSWGPDAYRLKIETRPWPFSNKQLVDFKVGVRQYRLHNGNIVNGSMSETNYLNENNGGNSKWCYMNSHFDGIKINLVVRIN